MTILKCWNSGCASNSSAVSGGGISSRAPVSSVSIGPSAIRDTFLDFASQLLISNATTNDLFHNSTKPFPRPSRSGCYIGSFVRQDTETDEMAQR
jgi:hypothetical protein